MAFEPSGGALWIVVNKRDETGDDTPPDYLTSVIDGGFYGWPYSYWVKNVDERVLPQWPDHVPRAITPDYALGAHTAALGLAYYEGSNLPEPFRRGMLVGQHGSSNRTQYSPPTAGTLISFTTFRDSQLVATQIPCLSSLPPKPSSIQKTQLRVPVCTM
jgi:glucose/arabinose dehydrogenase